MGNFISRGRTTFCCGYWVDPTRMPGMATGNASNCQPGSLKKAVRLVRFGSVGGTTGVKSTRGRKHWRNQPPVHLDQKIWHTPHNIPTGALPRDINSCRPQPDEAFRHLFGGSNRSKGDQKKRINKETDPTVYRTTVETVTLTGFPVRP